MHDARAVLPPGNTVQQWDKIAEDTVVGSGAFQNEGLIYMAYVSNAMYRADHARRAARAVAPTLRSIEAAYTALVALLPGAGGDARRVCTRRRSTRSRTTTRRWSA